MWVKSKNGEVKWRALHLPLIILHPLFNSVDLYITIFKNVF